MISLSEKELEGVLGSRDVLREDKIPQPLQVMGHHVVEGRTTTNGDHSYRACTVLGECYGTTRRHALLNLLATTWALSDCEFREQLQEYLVKRSMRIELEIP